MESTTTIFPTELRGYSRLEGQPISQIRERSAHGYLET